jgi:hypothetical protein
MIIPPGSDRINRHLIGGLRRIEGRQRESPRLRVCRRPQRVQPTEPAQPIEPNPGPHDPGLSGQKGAFSRATCPYWFYCPNTTLHRRNPRIAGSQGRR